jgi:hypothetical protein
LGAIGEPDAPLTTEADAPAATAEEVVGKKPPGPKAESNVTTETWADYMQRQLGLAAATGEPGAVEAERKRIYAQMQTGFLRNATRAIAYQGQGALEQATQALNRAYQFLPDGNTAEFAISEDRKNIIARIKPEKGAVAPSANTPGLVAFPSTPGPDGYTQLQKFVGHMQDPLKFSTLLNEEALKRDELAVKQKNAKSSARNAQSSAINAQTNARAEKRLQSTASRANALHDSLLAAGIPTRKAEAEVTKLEAEAKAAPDVAQARILSAKASLERQKRLAAVAKKLETEGMDENELVRNIARFNQELLDVNEAIEFTDEGSSERERYEVSRDSLTNVLTDLNERYKRRSPIKSEGAKAVGLGSPVNPHPGPFPSLEARNAKVKPGEFYIDPNGVTRQRGK